MVNLDLLKKSIPVAPLKIAALRGCTEMAATVNRQLVSFRKELRSRNSGVLQWPGYFEDSFLINATAHVLEPAKEKALFAIQYVVPIYTSCVT